MLLLSRGDIVNKKGFNLVELLATLVILSLVVGISVVGIIGSIDNAKKKAEKEFLNQLANAVDVYMNTCASGTEKDINNCQDYNQFTNAVTNYIFNKCSSTSSDPQCQEYIKYFSDNFF